MKIKLTENKLKQIVAESVKNILSEAISPDYRSALKQLFAKSFGNLDDNEKQYLYDLVFGVPIYKCTYPQLCFLVAIYFT